MIRTSVQKYWQLVLLPSVCSLVKKALQTDRTNLGSRSALRVWFYHHWSADYMLQEKSHWRKQRVITKFTTASKRERNEKQERPTYDPGWTLNLYLVDIRFPLKIREHLVMFWASSIAQVVFTFHACHLLWGNKNMCFCANKWHHHVWRHVMVNFISRFPRTVSFWTWATTNVPSTTVKLNFYCLIFCSILVQSKFGNFAIRCHLTTLTVPAVITLLTVLSMTLEWNKSVGVETWVSVGLTVKHIMVVFYCNHITTKIYELTNKSYETWSPFSISNT